MSTDSGLEPIYLDLATESENPDVTEIESVCMNCYEQGTTRLLLTSIPHFREVMVSSFSCTHCHLSDSSLMSTGDWQDRGIKFTLLVKNALDLKRMLVKSDFASIKIPEVELEVPGRGDKGEITSVEGVINKVVEGLSYDQTGRRDENSELAEKIDEYIAKLKSLLEVQEPFTLELNDPTGNSYIERIGFNGVTDHQLTSQEYERPPQLEDSLKTVKENNDDKQKEKLDQLKEENEDESECVEIHSDNKEQKHGEKNNDDGSSNSKENSNKENEKLEEEDDEDLHSEVMQFHTQCDRCNSPAATNMKLTKIPHFKEVVIMATVCDNCGNKTSEVKSGSGISEKGRRIILSIGEDHSFDMARDVLKSETCSVEVPELDLLMGAFILVGRFTTVEGMLVSVKEDMDRNPFFVGDSVEKVKKDRVASIFQGIDKIISGDMKGTLILDDPAGNSYIQNLYAPDPDPGLEVIEYERTFDQNEDLGINDMITEGYEQDGSKQQQKQ